MPNHSHRAGRLKQTNKRNKRSSASKRSLNRKQGGKVQSAAPRSGPKSRPASGGSARLARANAAKQRRSDSRRAAVDARRGLAGSAAGQKTSLGKALSSPPPRVVGIISLSEDERGLEESVRASLLRGAEHVVGPANDTAGTAPTASHPSHSRGGSSDLTVLTNSTAFRSQYAGGGFGEENACVQGALDLCRVCDLVLFAIDGSTVVSRNEYAAALSGGTVDDRSVRTGATTAHLDHVVCERGDGVLAAIKAQGVPSPVTVIVHRDGDAASQDGAAGLLGRHVGVAGGELDDEAMEEDEDEYEEAMNDGLASLPGRSHATMRSAKSVLRSRARRRAELRRYVGRFAATEFGESGSRVAELDLDGAAASSVVGVVETDASSVSSNLKSVATGATASKASSTHTALIRTACTAAASGPNWVSDSSRPYLVTDGTASDGSSAVSYDEGSRELRLTGYVRGRTVLDANRLVHVPHCGTFAVKSVCLAGVESREDVLPPIMAAGRKGRRKAAAADDVMEDAESSGPSTSKGGEVLATPDPEERESTEMFANPDCLEGEQNLIGFDENEEDQFKDEEAAGNTFTPGEARPAGWSDYQSAWLDAIPDADEDDEDRGELAFALNKKTTPGGDADTVMDDDDVGVSREEKRSLLAQRKKDREDDMRFPDEVDHEEETSARDRFARYRALKSFRKSHWDPKENLPESYGAVYHFASFKATQRDVMADVRETDAIARGRGCGLLGEAKDEDRGMADSDDEEDEAIARSCVPSGSYVTITLEGVPPEAYARLSPASLVSAVSLLPHENKVSVLHMGLSQTSGCHRDDELPVKSKDELTFRAGWRTWRGRPTFSQNNLNSDKHKFERYMPTDGAFFAGSAFGPVTFGSCPVLVFRDGGGGEVGGGRTRDLLAHGSMLGADADRIALKRIVLTGYPTRVHKRHATVKYMFYNPEDVRWFAPAGLTTKHGLQGHVVQSVGVHGVMKCLFNAPIKQHDTVCLPLYKRVYPKFVRGEGSGGTGEGEGGFRVL